MPRYAARLIRLVPQLKAREVVQYALSAYPHADDLEPETAAEMHASAFREGQHPGFRQSAGQGLKPMTTQAVTKQVMPMKKAAARVRASFG
jgi:hypothetical protein